MAAPQQRDLPNDKTAVELARFFANNPDKRMGVTAEGFDSTYPNPVFAMRFCIDLLYHYIIFSQKLTKFPSKREDIDQEKVSEAVEIIANFCGYRLSFQDAPEEYLAQMVPGTKFNLQVNPTEPMDKWWFIDANLKYLITFAPLSLQA